MIDFRGAGPLVVFVHGGFWRPEYDRAHAGPLSAGLAEAGFTVATIEYRRTGWEGSSADVRAALASLDEPRVVIGHSAGGHLALLFSPVPVLALAPVTDLPRAYELDLDGGAVRDFLGGSPAGLPDVYAAAEPSRPATLIHGTLDEQVPVELSRAYAARTGSRLVELPDTEHFGLIDPLSAAWPSVLSELRALL